MCSHACTSFGNQNAYPQKWTKIRGTHSSISAGAPCFLSVRKRPLRLRSVHPLLYSAPHNQLSAVVSGEGTRMDERDLMDKDKLILRGLQFHGFHGVNQEEKNLGQKFVVDVDAWLDLSAAGESDSISDTVSYTDIYRIVKGVVEGPSQNLLESVAHLIATNTLLKFPQITAVRVKVGKPHVAVQGVVDYLGVEILRYKENMKGNSF